MLRIEAQTGWALAGRVRPLRGLLQLLRVDTHDEVSGFDIQKDYALAIGLRAFGFSGKNYRRDHLVGFRVDDGSVIAGVIEGKHAFSCGFEEDETRSFRGIDPRDDLTRGPVKHDDLIAVLAGGVECDTMRMLESRDITCHFARVGIDDLHARWHDKCREGGRVYPE